MILETLKIIGIIRRYNMKLKPMGSRVLIKRIEIEEKTKGGILIPETSREKSYEGIVVAVGDGHEIEDGSIIPLNVKENDVIIFSKNTGTELVIDDVEYVILEEKDILGIRNNK